MGNMYGLTKAQLEQLQNELANQNQVSAAWGTTTTASSGTSWNPGTYYPPPPPPSVYTDVPINEEKLKEFIREEIKKQILDYIDRFSDDGITIPVEALRKELNGK